MTGTELDVETQAHQIAARGREALVERTRTAYGDAVAAHADVISLDDEHIEAMVQSAVDRADGLQWRRALADVAAQEFGISATEALSHPAVLRAQALVGAPSYEQSLAELIARPVPLAAATSVAPIADNGAAATAAVPEPEPPEPQPPLPEPLPEPPAPEPATAVALEEPQAIESGADGLETVEADDVMLELLPEPDPIEYETEVYDVEASFVEAEDAPPAPEPFAVSEQQPPLPTNPFSTQQIELPAEELPVGVEDEHPSASIQEEEQDGTLLTEQEDAPLLEEESVPLTEEEIEVSFPAIHLGGVANLPTKREGLSVRLSSDGLDIMQGPRSIIGRLVWDEIEALEAPNVRARRRQKQVRARLVVRTPHGDASFEVPDVTAEDLRDRVEPLMRRYGRH
jgi:hypothetical protein